MNKRIVIICLIVCPLLSWGQSFIYPVLPDSVYGRQDRINYMTEHFWTERAIADTTNFQGPKLLLDYLYLLKQTDERQKCVQSFVSLACKQKNTFGQILYWLDQILYDSSSPHYNENLYSLLMNAVIISDADSVMKMIPRQRMKIISKNQVGNQANDFSFIDKEGRTNSLYKIEVPLLLLVFNNPDCSLCHQTEKNIAQNELLQSLLNSGKLRLLAITPDADYEDWMEHKYPSNWIVGYDGEKVIYSQRLYDIQRLPCLYLLDKDKRVLLKEADYDRLCKYMSGKGLLFER